MNLADAAHLKVIASNAPNNRVTLEVGTTHITMPAVDVAQMMIEWLNLSLPARARASVEFSSSVELSPAEAARVRAFMQSAPGDWQPPPRIGQPWLREAGIYAGVVRGDEGEPDYHLVVAHEQRESNAWKDASDWAQALWIEGFRDFTLPKRREQAVLFGNVPELFAKEAYWSCEPSTEYPEYAWCQGFSGGYQCNIHKSSKLRARAVRRVAI